MNPANLHQLCNANREDYLAVFDHNEDFRLILKNWINERDFEYYCCEIIQGCFERRDVTSQCFDFDNCGYTEIMFRFKDGFNTAVGTFVAGVEKAQQNYCLLPDDLKQELDLLYKCRDEWADCTDPEKDEELHGILVAMCDNFAAIIEETINQSLRYYDEHPKDLRDIAGDYVELCDEDEYYDSTDYILYKINEIS